MFETLYQDLLIHLWNTGAHYALQGLACDKTVKTELLQYLLQPPVYSNLYPAGTRRSEPVLLAASAEKEFYEYFFKLPSSGAKNEVLIIS